jgi:hypothetical protein
MRRGGFRVEWEKTRSSGDGLGVSFREIESDAYEIILYCFNGKASPLEALD